MAVFASEKINTFESSTNLFSNYNYNYKYLLVLIIKKKNWVNLKVINQKNDPTHWLAEKYSQVVIQFSSVS